MKPQHLIIGVVVVLALLAAIGYWYQNKQSSESENTQATTTQTTQSNDQSDSSSESNSTDDTKTEVSVQTTTLKAVEDYTGSGSATRVFANGTFTHTVSAKIADPASGKFIEGWLVNMSLTPKFFSTGKLKKENGEYKLTFTENKDYTKYNNIVITEETEANGLDGVPEAHVLEGTFPN